MGLQKATSPIVAYACSLPNPDDMVVCMQTPLMATLLGWCYACLPRFYPLFLRQKHKLLYISEMSAVQTRHRPTYLPQHNKRWISQESSKEEGSWWFHKFGNQSFSMLTGELWSLERSGVPCDWLNFARAFSSLCYVCERSWERRPHTIWKPKTREGACCFELQWRFVSVLL